MATKMIQLKPTKVASILDDIGDMQNRITQLAYDFFLNRGGFGGRDIDDWLTAESELTWRPAVELCEKDDEFRVEAALAGVNPKNLEIRVTPQELLITGEMKHEHAEDRGTVHHCEFSRGKLFRCIRFPKEIDPDKVKAEFRDGLLRVSAAVAQQVQARKVKIAAS